MTQSQLEFSASKSDAAKQRGMALAEANSTLLEKAREVALWLGRHRGTIVTIDEVMKALSVYGHKPDELGNASGSVFKTKDWRCIGFVKSTRVSNHSRIIREWVRR